MRDNNRSDRGEVVKMLSLITQIGITVLTTIFLCVLTGIFVDKLFGTHLLMVFIILGTLASFKSVYLLLVKVGVVGKDRDSHNEQENIETDIKEESDDETEGP